MVDDVLTADPLDLEAGDALLHPVETRASTGTSPAPRASAP
jgi:hypothetical protein